MLNIVICAQIVNVCVRHFAGLPFAIKEGQPQLCTGAVAVALHGAVLVFSTSLVNLIEVASCSKPEPLLLLEIPPLVSVALEVTRVKAVAKAELDRKWSHPAQSRNWSQQSAMVHPGCACGA